MILVFYSWTALSGVSESAVAMGITDDRGRVLAERPTNAAPFATLVAQIPVVHHDTLYSKWGDWFAWVCIAIFVATLATSRRKRS